MFLEATHQKKYYEQLPTKIILWKKTPLTPVTLNRNNGSFRIIYINKNIFFNKAFDIKIYRDYFYILANAFRAVLLAIITIQLNTIKKIQLIQQQTIGNLLAIHNINTSTFKAFLLFLTADRNYMVNKPPVNIPTITQSCVVLSFILRKEHQKDLSLDKMNDTCFFFQCLFDK